jgi:hypothetical protein
MENDYEQNWGKLTDDTLPRQDYWKSERLDIQSVPERMQDSFDLS